MAAFVLDASMTLSWYFADEESATSLAVEDLTDSNAVVVPGHWFAEVANALVMGERRGRASVADSARFIDRLADLTLEVDEVAPSHVFDRILPLARAHGLTVYDTLYLELAERRGLPLASLDGQLNDAARRVGVELLEYHA
jgi:predicted nucleic acid-binding protein